MKVVDWDEFVRLGNVVYFIEGEYELCVKECTIMDDTKAIDFFYQPLCDFNWNESGERQEALMDSLSNGISLEINDSICRDGMYDHERKFIVYEEKDLEYLLKLIKEQLTKAKLKEKERDR